MSPPLRFARSKITGAMAEATEVSLEANCLGLEETPEPRQEITSSRSFGAAGEDLRGAAEAVMTYTARAGEKLRRGSSVAGAYTTDWDQLLVVR